MFEREFGSGGSRCMGKASQEAMTREQDCLPKHSVQAAWLSLEKCHSRVKQEKVQGGLFCKGLVK